MTKSLQEIQKENRKFILEAIYGCSYEEAIEKELGVGCKVKIKRFFSIKDFNEEIFIIDNYCDFFTENLFRTIGSSYHNEITEIIGKPLTLSRVLLALKDKEIGYYDSGLGYIEYEKKLFSHDWYYEVRYICYWDLTIETLEEQSEETQRRVNKLLTGE